MRRALYFLTLRFCDFIMEIHKECRYLYGGLYGKVFSIMEEAFFRERIQNDR